MSAVVSENKDGVYYITFNRPEKKNAFNFEVLENLYQSLRRAKEEKAQMVIIRGSGGAFSAGGDLSEFKNIDVEKLSEGMELLEKSVMMIRELDAIVIAVLEGPVSGAAVGVSLACDLSVASKDAFINLSFRRIGFSVDGGGSILLPRIIGAKRANELFLFARNLNMDEAHSAGVVNFVWETEVLEDKIMEMIAELRKLPMSSIRHFKALTNNAVFLGLNEQLKREAAANCELFSDPSFKARLAAMFAKK